MKSLVLALVTFLVLGASLASADQGRSPKQGDRRESRVHAFDRSFTPAMIVFAPHDIELIRTHYSSRYRDLPPGLQKKLARGGSLPPGWEKKLERFPAMLERELVVLPPDHARGVMDGHAVIYNPITHAILDIVSLF
jgi:hypothetical protein